MEMVHHQEAALQKIIVQAFSFLVGERPILNVDGVDPGIVEEMVALEIGNVQWRRGVDAGQPPQGNQAIVIGLGDSLASNHRRRRSRETATAAGEGLYWSRLQ